MQRRMGDVFWLGLFIGMPVWGSLGGLAVAIFAANKLHGGNDVK